LKRRDCRPGGARVQAGVKPHGTSPSQNRHANHRYCAV